MVSLLKSVLWSVLASYEPILREEILINSKTASSPNRTPKDSKQLEKSINHAQASKLQTPRSSNTKINRYLEVNPADYTSLIRGYQLILTIQTADDLWKILIESKFNSDTPHGVRAHRTFISLYHISIKLVIVDVYRFHESNRGTSILVISS